jgi:uncharacterized oligopeptide transporter (OPT) family protein
MNDFKSGHILHSDPKAQWISECIGGIVGAFVTVGVFYVILSAYGPTAFGNPKCLSRRRQGPLPPWSVGSAHDVLPRRTCSRLRALLHKLPVMTLGLGVYLPFYLSATAFLGGALKFVVEKAAPEWDKKGTGMIIASGLLGGEAVVGVIIALIQAAQGMSAM